MCAGASKWRASSARGAGYDWAYTDPLPVPSNIITQGGYAAWQIPTNTSLPQSFQPFAEFEMAFPLLKLVVTAGIKAAIQDESEPSSRTPDG